MFPPIEELLSHRGNMLLIDRVIDSGPDGIRVEAKVDGNAWYADASGAMPAWIGLELMAQAIAAQVGLVARAQGLPPKQGLLLGTRAFNSRIPAFVRDRVLIIVAKEVFQETNGLGAFDAHIELGGEIVAEATLKVFEPANFEAILEQGT